MKNFSKKIVGLLLVVALSVTCVFAFTGCIKVKDPIALELENAQNEVYGLCVKKGNNELKEKLNKFLAKESTKEAIKVSYKYHDVSEKTDKHIDYPDLSNNTGITYTMVTEAGFPPYEYEGKSAGSVNGVVGLDVDIMMLFCEEQNAKLEIKDMGFDCIIPEVNTSNTKIGAAGITITPDRKENVDFTDGYIGSVQYVVSSKKNSYTKLEDLNGKKIGVQTQTIGHLILEQAVKDGKIDVEIKGYDAYASAYLDFLNGKLDAIVMDKSPALTLLSNN